MRQISILPLSADPLTPGHEMMALAAYGVTKKPVWLMPCYQHLFGKKMAQPEHRLRMCGIVAQAQQPWLHVCDFEIANKLTVCSYEIMLALREHYNLTTMPEWAPSEDYEFSVIIGMDNANIIEKPVEKGGWQRGAEFIKDFPFIVVRRNGVEPTCDWFTKPPHQVVDLDWPGCSSDIRKWIEEGKTTCPPNFRTDIWDYIRLYNLYTGHEEQIEPPFPWAELASQVGPIRKSQ